MKRLKLSLHVTSGAPVNPDAPDATITPRGVFLQHSFPGQRVMIAIDSNGLVRRRIEVRESDIEPDEVAQMRAWLDRHDGADGPRRCS